MTVPMLENPSTRRIRVLLVDDDEDDFLLTRETVADIPGGGYTLEWEADFDTALDRICRHEFDVHLVDFRLGAKTGLDLLRKMRERRCHGPVILLTGVGQPEIDRAATEAGAADYLEKSSLDPVLLERALRYAMRQRATEADLERKVAERTAELAAANDALRDADRRKDEFLATLGHELRNPLAPLRNSLEIMRLAADNPAAVEAARGMMERQLRHMVRLINDLLDASRITRDKLRVELAPIDLRDPLHSAVETARPLLDEAGVAFDLTLPDDPLPVNGDHVRLGQLFANLLTNAAKYTERDGRAGLTAVVDGRQVVVRVTDTGVGLPPHLLGRVFDLFTQVDRTLNRSQGGLGIGLALVKRLTEMHGGTVSAHSDGVGQGATFEVRLPLLADPAPVVCQTGQPTK
jgi:signal transduction histidine kinase